MHFRYTLVDTCMQSVCAWHAHYSNTTIITNNKNSKEVREKEKRVASLLSLSLVLSLLNSQLGSHKQKNSSFFSENEKA